MTIQTLINLLNAMPDKGAEVFTKMVDVQTSKTVFETSAFKVQYEQHSKNGTKYLNITMYK